MVSQKKKKKRKRKKEEDPPYVALNYFWNLNQFTLTKNNPPNDQKP